MFTSQDNAVKGIDVSNYQNNIDWSTWWDQGVRFAFIKATEGIKFTSPYFREQYDGACKIGMIRGAYHFALPDRSSGAEQAEYFVDNGGGWKADGKTLPGVLDLESNPYGQTFYGLTGEQMTAWIKDFSDTYRVRSGRLPIIYTSTNWWKFCGVEDFSETHPLWVAHYADSPGPLPPNWTSYTFWQYSSHPVDRDLFNGPLEQLRVLALAQ